MSIAVSTPEQMRELAARVASVCRPGDLVVLDGDLGAGKTTFAQGFGAALGVADPITSPTFVIARVYRASGLHLVHVDAYRVGSTLELDDLDLDADVDASVTLVEWGMGKVEQLTDDRLVVHIARSIDPADETRTVCFEGVGARWSAAELEALDAAC